MNNAYQSTLCTGLESGAFVKLESKIFLQEYLGFILAISESIRGKKIRDPDLEAFPTVQKLLDMLVILRHLSNLV